MRWHELSGPNVAALAQQTQVALLPVGCVEMHGPHLPTGTDAFVAEKLADMIAEREPCIVLPTLYYNTNHLQRSNPGVIAIPPQVVASLYEAICDEAARNGFHKIAILVAHGSSERVAYFFQDMVCEWNTREDRQPKPYTVYVLYGRDRQVLEDHEYDTLWASPRGLGGHGSEWETSLVMASRPELVHLDRLEPLPQGQGTLNHPAVPDATYAVDFREIAPKGYCGRPHHATAAKGLKALEARAELWAGAIRQIKAHDPTTGL